MHSRRHALASGYKAPLLFVACLQTTGSTKENRAGAEFVSHLTLAADGASARLSFPLSGWLESCCPLSSLPQTWGSVEGITTGSRGKDFIYVFRRRRSGVLTAVDHRWRGRQGLVMFALVRSGLWHCILFYFTCHSNTEVSHSGIL